MFVCHHTMAYLYSCCVYFSLRLGTILVGIGSSIQGVIMLALAIVVLDKPEEFKGMVEATYDEYLLPDLVDNIRDSVFSDPKKYASLVIAFSAFYLIYCVSLTYGAYTFNTYLMYPFIVCEFVRLLILFMIHILTMMVVKLNVLNLGVLIGLSVLGGFVLLGMFYMWLCTLSLLQVIKELMREIEVTDISNFPKKPATISDMYAIGGIRYYNNY